MGGMMQRRPSSCSTTATGNTGLETLTSTQGYSPRMSTATNASSATLCGRTTRDRLVNVVDIREDEPPHRTMAQEDRLVKVEEIDEDEPWLYPLGSFRACTVCNVEWWLNDGACDCDCLGGGRKPQDKQSSDFLQWTGGCERISSAASLTEGEL